ncbi:MAG: DNA gyrase subunit A [Geminicoccaceae bacterium]|nr:MAG: DNA gyrase subunit A [Geminicoccaceae bacterium]
MADETLTKALDIVPIEEEMKRSYLDYAMSVIVSRALPDVRDGLKPVHRRILYAMDQGGYGVGRPHRKSARIVGDVMGKYHPHGDSAIYDAMVRMAQDFSMRLPLIDGQGNFGSLDGDPPAAMRYTEARLAQAASTLLADIDKDTVDFRPNYDESDEEPVVLPAQFPNLLVNGAGGIAVGMATNIPPHNLGEIIDACTALVDRPDMDVSELIEMVPGPDFPTAGIIMGKAGIQRAYLEGKGGIVVRGRAAIEEIRKDRFAIVITEVPYQVNKAKLVERIAEVVREKKVEGVSDLRDESDRRGVRVVVELKRDADGEVVLNQLYRFTTLQTSFGINMVALSGGRPQQLTLKVILEEFLAFREEVILRRSAFDLQKARDRAHNLIGLIVAVANIDEVIRLIRASADADEARAALLARDWPIADIGPLLALVDEAPTGTGGTYRLSDVQAKAILDLRLQRLTALERQKLEDEINELGERIAELLSILRSREKLLTVLKDEMALVKTKFATPRRTEIDETGDVDIDIEELIPREDMIVTVTRKGYIKRVPLATYRAQHRGGKGRSGMATHEDDFVTRLFVANTHTPVLFFSSLGKVYKLKVYKLPLGTPQARGKAMVNLFPHVAAAESITAVMPLPEDEGTWADLHVMFATNRGKVRRNDLSDFTFVPVNGKIAMGLEDDDRLVDVQVCEAGQDILLAAKGGKCVRFPVTAVRVFQSRSSTGVRGMDLAAGDEVVSMSVLKHVAIDIEERDAYLRSRRRTGEEDEGAVLDAARVAELAAAEEMILTITERGYGKRTSAFEYRVTNRGGQGIINIETSARNGAVVATFPVGDDDQIVLTTSGGQVLRTPVSGERGVRITGRNAQGVIIFDVGADERVVSVARIGENGEAEAAAVPDDGGANGGADDGADGGGAV